MAAPRNSRQVAGRALILGAIAFRSSLEVTDHPRVAEISQRLLHWLEEMGCGEELDPLERELLATPFGQLSDGQTTDANWAGEAAAFFCWMLDLAPPLDETKLAVTDDLPVVHCILKPEAAEFLRSASLRDRAQIEETCRRFVLIQSLLRESRIEPPGRDIVRRLTVKKLEDVGLAVTEDAMSRAEEIVGRMTPPERSLAAGLYVVRVHAAMWCLSDRGV
ncbi:MAG TPA: DUF4272 domain-containing protein [Planctomycetia bacterium]|jgi:hypothetical protein|nr:DUF4272 domain-containing protein [Planctomycetia bacterium]